VIEFTEALGAGNEIRTRDPNLGKVMFLISLFLVFSYTYLNISTCKIVQNWAFESINDLSRSSHYFRFH